ncbi:MAG: hypothetical protein ABSH51_22930, partial [Solirubrobacteraceae bacterium]
MPKSSRVAGAEVVEDEPHAERFERRQRLGEAVLMADHHALGQLQRQAPRVEPGAAQRGGDRVGECAVGDLDGRQIDRHRQRGVVGALAMPARGLPARPVQHPAADRLDQPVLLGHRDELPGRDPAAFGVLPADQGLDGDHRAVGQRHQRLVVERQLIAFQRAPQVVLDPQPGDRPSARALVEQLVAGTAALLGPVQRGVGVSDQVVGDLA